MRTLTLNEFNDLMNNWSKILIFCYWTNCAKCRMFEPELERVEWQISVPLYKVNAEEDTDMANALSVSDVPYLILIQNWKKLNEFIWINRWEEIINYFDIWISE